MFVRLYSSICSPEEESADGLEDKIWHPDDKMREKFGSKCQVLRQEDEAEVDDGQYQGDGHADVCLAPVDTDGQRNADQGEAKGREGKGNLAVHINADLFYEILRHFAHITERGGGLVCGDGLWELPL